MNIFLLFLFFEKSSSIGIFFRTVNKRYPRYRSFNEAFDGLEPSGWMQPMNGNDDIYVWLPNKTTPTKLSTLAAVY